MLPPFPNIPLPDPTKVPDAERGACQHLVGNLKALDHFRIQYRNAMVLLCECNEASEDRPSAISQIDRPEIRMSCADQKMRDAWRDIAFRDAAHTIYHFGYVLDGLVKCTYRCPTLMGSIDLAKLKTAQPLFEKCFPKAARMRNAIAHAGEFLQSPEKLAENKLFYAGKIDLGGIVIEGVTVSPIGSMSTGFHYYATFKSDVVVVELSPAKYDQMIEICGIVYDAFRNHV